MKSPLRNRALQVKVVKIDAPGTDNDEPIVELPTMDPQEINQILKEQVQNLGKTVLVVAAGITALTTAREVIVNNTNPANRR